MRFEKSRIDKNPLDFFLKLRMTMKFIFIESPVTGNAGRRCYLKICCWLHLLHYINIFPLPTPWGGLLVTWSVWIALKTSSGCRSIPIWVECVDPDSLFQKRVVLKSDFQQLVQTSDICKLNGCRPCAAAFWAHLALSQLPNIQLWPYPVLFLIFQIPI